MADLGNRAAVDAAIDALLDDLAPDGSILPSDHNALLNDILDTLSNGLSTTLRTGNTTGGYNLDITDGDFLRLEDGSYFGSFDSATLTADRGWYFPDQTGTIALLSDITGGASVYTESNTAFTDVEVTVDNTFNFIGGNLIKKGSDTLGTTTGFQLTDSANVSNWDFRNDGDIHQGKNSSFVLNGKSLLFDASITGATTPFEIKTTQLGGTGLSPYFKISNYGAVEILTRAGSTLRLMDSAGNEKFSFSSGNFKSTDNTLELTSSYITTKMTAGAWEYYNSGGTLLHSIMTALSPKVTFSRGGTGSIPFIVGTTANILTEKITLVGNTLVKGSDTSSATSGLILVDSANATNWDFRNNGDIHMGKDSTLFFNGNGLTIGGGSTALLGFHGATPVDQATTAITASAFVANTSTIVDDTATFGGYTMGQIAAALIEKGILA